MHGVGLCDEYPAIRYREDYETHGYDGVVEPGMVFCVEPMVNRGTWKTRILGDGWTVVTEDDQPSAHFEHSIVDTKGGPRILTITS